MAVLQARLPLVLLRPTLDQKGSCSPAGASKRKKGNSMIFRDRKDAGRILADSLRQYAGRKDVVVIALPRGGVPVAFEVAEKLNAPLDVVLVQKLGTPGQPELAMGAIASGDVKVLNRYVVEQLGIAQDQIDAAVAREQEELHRRERFYRGNRAPVDVRGRTVILIDDGLATGSSMRAAAAAIRQRQPARVVLAVPVASESTCNEMKREFDELICGLTPMAFYAVGQWYQEFSQTTDEEVRELLTRSAARISRESKAA
jgi:predicted phosphoribosyltransferase